MPTPDQGDNAERGFLVRCMLLSFPTLTFAVCPVFASPFTAAKSCVLFAFGAAAWLLWRGSPTVVGRTHFHCADFPAGNRNFDGLAKVIIGCVAGWAIALWIATVIAGQ